MSDERPDWFDAAAQGQHPGEPAAWSQPAVVPARARTRRGVAAVVVLSVLLVGALALGGYLWLAADRWRADSGAWQAQAHAQAQRVAELEADLEASSQELTSARDQLATATARITTLADEKAQLGDTNAATQQYLDYQRRVSEAAGVVADALGRCTAGQSQLITYLRAPEQYDADDLDRFAGEVDALCQQATDANTQLQQELAQ
ncbi:hypothetical protein [Xylanimonas ulmi]|uniref:hypothetical protein n=1 Tax=Xylanimonas ulmi TaxID=228973 RepID=UPI001F5FC700|nr:hypothetical protein [Xylanibacterium ulmi]